MKKKIFALVLACMLVTGCAKNENVNESVSSVSSVDSAGSASISEDENKDTVSNTDVSVEENMQKTSASTEPEVVEEVVELADPMYADFLNGCPSTFERSGDWTNGSMFNVTWRKTSCTFEDGKLQLTIDFDKNGKDIPYSGAELRSKDFYGYGRYEVSMKAIKNDGVVSSFFTYTGPSDKNPWDEIDIEILGKNTETVQFNYFTNGKGNHEKVVELGFDASEDFHTYAFEWRKDRIDWFVDGELVHTASVNIPKTEGKIMMNAWCGTGVDSWLKPFDDSNLPLTAEYQWISYTPISE